MAEERVETRFGVVRQGLDAPEPATSTVRRSCVCVGVRSCAAANENERTRVYERSRGCARARLRITRTCAGVCVYCVCARPLTLSYESRRRMCRQHSTPFAAHIAELKRPFAPPLTSDPPPHVAVLSSCQSRVRLSSFVWEREIRRVVFDGDFATAIVFFSPRPIFLPPCPAGVRVLIQFFHRFFFAALPPSSRVCYSRHFGSFAERKRRARRRPRFLRRATTVESRKMRFSVGI